MGDRIRSPQLNPWLPMDILATYILPRLLARSLLQCKCVCKFFRTLISSSQFINLHLRFHPISSTTNRIFILVSGNYNYNKGDGDGDDHEQDECLYAVALDSQTKRPRALNLPLPQTVCERKKYTKNYSIYVAGSCNGLVCLGFPWADLSKGVRKMCWGEYFMFLNPLTGFMFTSETLSFNRKGHRFGGRSVTSFEFEFDCINGDYKLVAATGFYPSLRGRGGREVEIYSMKAQSWKCVEEAATNQAWFQVSQTRGVLIHTHLLHWIYKHASYNAMSRNVCFNLETEQWGSHDLRFPPEIGNYNQKTLGVLDGCLCLLLEIIPRKRNEVYVMKEYGVETSWMNLFSVTPWVPSTAFLYPFSRKRTNLKQVLLNLKLVGEGEGCFWCNFKKKTTTVTSSK